MNFLVLESDPIVTLDIMSILRDCFPDALVEQCSTLASAREQLAVLTDVAAVMVGLKLQAFAPSDLPAMIEEKMVK